MFILETERHKCFITDYAQNAVLLTQTWFSKGVVDSRYAYVDWLKIPTTSSFCLSALPTYSDRFVQLCTYLIFVLYLWKTSYMAINHLVKTQILKSFLRYKIIYNHEQTISIIQLDTYCEQKRQKRFLQILSMSTRLSLSHGLLSDHPSLSVFHSFHT